uniref:SFRICE_001792 n=1 Tax=Spodoptera frugiperda TaxID=7108 RepID=A0A2H1W2J6_SPOFR
MIIVKLIVFVCCFNGFSAIPTDYCEICLNHTLCKFKTPGPGPSCTAYDQSALLTNQDKFELINNINEKRNFVAMGHSKILPLAANMKKMYWSNELATAAQHWADQCDPSLYPDKEDQCRDLENVKVGQNIASILGPSPGLSVKSFVEMWFMQVLEYIGSVAFYNESQDYKTNYLTQLLWANTEYVGCGKSKFYVHERNTIIERLVCNFAPKGNAHGRPVYSIGYPGTQCRNNMKPDDNYHGLCAHKNDYTKLMSQNHRPINSLLRILNLSNDSVKQEIDPIRSILRQNIVNSNSSNMQRNQKTRHIVANKTNGGMKRVPHMRKQLFRNNNLMNISENNNEYHYPYDRGHSHIYHGHEAPQHNYESTTPMNTNPNYRRYDYTTEPTNSYSSTNYRKFNQFGQCTRRMRLNLDNCGSHQCTKAPNECCQTMCPSSCTEASCSQFMEEPPCPHPYFPLSPEPCPLMQQTCPTPAITNCNYHTNCPCSTPCSTTARSCCLTSICPGIRKQNDEFDAIKTPSTYQYYDLIPNVVMRSGNHKMPLEVLSPRTKTHEVEKNKKIPKHKDSDLIHKTFTEFPKYNLQGDDYIYHSFGLRKRRQLNKHVSVKPFWQIENPGSKLLRFTTLPSNLKTKKSTKPARLMTTTEPITVSFKHDASHQLTHNKTEKYLSFDELMHLRKLNPKLGRNNSNPKLSQTNFRREGDEPDSSTPTVFTSNTKFVKVKHCTRKLTCTWTAFTGTAADGETNYGQVDVGKRTLPGYVEGCTQTFTCTREFWDRNKGRTSPITDAYETTDDSNAARPDDGDYCERRSLNVQRRNSDTKKQIPNVVRYFPYTNIPFENINTEINLSLKGSDTTESILERHECDCNNNYGRRKREGAQYLRGYDEKNTGMSVSYSDIYHSILNRIFRSNQINKLRDECLCNEAKKSTPTMFYKIIIFQLVLDQIVFKIIT